MISALLSVEPSRGIHRLGLHSGTLDSHGRSGVDAVESGIGALLGSCHGQVAIAVVGVGRLAEIADDALVGQTSDGGERLRSGIEDG